MAEPAPPPAPEPEPTPGEVTPVVVDAEPAAKKGRRR